MRAKVQGIPTGGCSVAWRGRWGPEVFAPFSPAGGADILVAFEKIEAARYAALLAPGGTAIVNDFAIEPITVITGGAHYPDDAAIEAAFADGGQRLMWIHGARVAEELGNKFVANVVLLGALSTLLGLPEAAWAAVLDRRVKAAHLEINHRAFAAGRAEMSAPAPTRPQPQTR